MDPQVVELLGRNRLVSDLLRAGLEVALPARDRGVDLIAYADLSRNVRRFVARPIQMKAAVGKSFSIDRKYARIRDLVYAYVWFVGEPERTQVFALAYSQSIEIAKRMGYTKTASWKRGRYVATRPGRRLHLLLEPYRMTPKKWWGLVVEADQ